MSQRSGLSALPFGSAILGLMVLSGALLQLRPFESRRQPGAQVAAELTSPVEEIDSRLAEDPLEAMVRHFDRGKPATRRREMARLADDLHTGKESCAGKKRAACLEEIRRLQGLTSLQAAVADGLRPATAQNVAPKMTVLAVSLRGGELAEAVELRRRLRTAVVSSLARRGFVADQGGNLSFVAFPFLATSRRIGFDLHSPLDPETGFIPVPYELFSAAAETDLQAGSWQVLVFWLDDQLFQGSEGLAALSELMAAAAPGQAELLEPRLLGPASSGKLEEILAERRLRHSGVAPRTCVGRQENDDPLTLKVCATAPRIFDALKIYSNLATAPATLADARKLAEFYPVLADDGQLLEAMAEELRLRSIRLVGEEGGTGKRGDRVAILTEIDTPYGRAMAGSLAKALQREKVGRFSAKMSDAEPILLHTYFRGIDGEGVGIAPSAAGEKSAKEGPDALEKAQGRGLFDYIRRLGIELWRQDHDLRLHGSRIAAIGILGSDYYDKQLLLQALRPWFPDTVFFTTDLDTRFLHPSEQAWNRNLLIASSFDTRLSPSLQGPVPPFRDTYSTSTFLGGLLALGRCAKPSSTCSRFDQLHQNAEQKLPPEPLLFEVGRTAAIRLVPAGAASSSPAHPSARELLASPLNSFDAILVDDRPLKDKAGPYFGIVAFAVLLVLMSSRLRQGRRPLFILTAVVIGLSAFASIGHFFALEPGAWLEGVSVRATEFCRLLILALAIGLYLRGRYRLAESEQELLPYFTGVTRESSPTEPAAPARGLEKIRRNLWELSLHRAYAHLSRQGESTGAAVDAALAWRRYQTLQRDSPYGNPRALRVLFYAAAALVAGGILVLSGLVHYPSVPIRGEDALMADRFLRYLTLAALGVMAIWCFDVIRLASAFVSELASGPTQWPEGSRIDEIAANQGIDRKVLGEYLDIEVIAKLTESLAPIVLFPFGLTALFIVSRSSVFDAWRWPWLLALVVGTLLAVVLVAASLLWRAAEKARRASLDRLEELRLQVVAQPPKEVGASEKQLQALIAEIKANQRGAFAPWTANPLLGSLLLPFGGAGASGLLDFFVHLGL